MQAHVKSLEPSLSSFGVNCPQIATLNTHRDESNILTIYKREKLLLYFFLGVLSVLG